MIKLIASDMDGTLLNEAMELSFETVTAIKAAQQQGIQFIIATGRGYANGYSLLRAQGIACPFIALNGAATYDEKGQCIHTQPLSPNQVLNIYDAIDHTAVHLNFTTAQHTYAADKAQYTHYVRTVLGDINPHLVGQDLTQKATDFLKNAHVRYIKQLPDVVSSLNEPILKIALQSLEKPKALPDIEHLLHQTIPDISITSSSSLHLEVNHATATKGNALARYAQTLGIDASEVITIGDGLNDLSMITWAGHGIAVDNAHPQLKQSANAITSTNKAHGVARVIHQLLESR